MEIKELESFIQDLHNNVVRERMPKSVHYTGKGTFSNGYACLNDVIPQYLGLMNDPNKISLNKVYQKLNNLGDHIDHPEQDTFYNPQEIADQLVGIGEALRKDYSTYGYVDKRSNLLYGVTSEQHTSVTDWELYNGLVNRYLPELGTEYKVSGDHNIKGMRLDIQFPEFEIKLGDNDYCGIRAIVRNSAYGHGALSLNGGLIRFVCTNGVIVTHRVMSFSQVHRGLSKQLIMTRFFEQLTNLFKQFTNLADKVEQASLITDAYISEKTTVVDWLPQNFDIRVKEAQEVFKLMRLNPKYRNTAFWIGQAVAEVGRDLLLDDRNRLETVAGQIMFAQL